MNVAACKVRRFFPEDICFPRKSHAHTFNNTSTRAPSLLPPGDFNATGAGGNDFVAVKLDAAGTEVWRWQVSAHPGTSVRFGWRGGLTLLLMKGRPVAHRDATLENARGVTCLPWFFARHVGGPVFSGVGRSVLVNRASFCRRYRGVQVAEACSKRWSRAKPKWRPESDVRFLCFHFVAVASFAVRKPVSGFPTFRGLSCGKRTARKSVTCI